MTDARTSSEAVTHSIRVRVEPAYEPVHSEPVEHRFVFSYRVHIRNEGARTVRLLRRSWLIINDDGDRQEVEGPGVVGFTPTLEPGEEFSYASFCPLDTRFGTMEVQYIFEEDEGGEFPVQIARFYLVAREEEDPGDDDEAMPGMD